MAWLFKGCNTVLWRLICYGLRVFQNFQDNPNFSEVHKKTFPQPLCLIFFWSRLLIERQTFWFWCWDTLLSALTSLEPFPEPLQNRICYILHSKCMYFSCFPITCSSAIWRSLFLRNRSHLRHFWYLQESWLNIIATFCWKILLRSDYSFVHSMKL